MARGRCLSRGLRLRSLLLDGRHGSSRFQRRPAAQVLDEVEAHGAEALRDTLRPMQRQSFAARFSTRLPRTGPKVSASYKWISGPVVSRQDAFGEVTYQVDPFLNLSLRQPIPGTLFSSKVEALADFRNLLAQGYVPVNAGDGQVLLIPAFRSFRGGFSFQF